MYRNVFRSASRLRIVSLRLSRRPPWNPSLRNPFQRILAANRDEVLDRATEHARFRRSFKDHVETAGHTEPDILCGLDLQAGGTWLGLNKTSGCVTFLYVNSVYEARGLAFTDDHLQTGRISRNLTTRTISREDTWYPLCSCPPLRRAPSKGKSKLFSTSNLDSQDSTYLSLSLVSMGPVGNEVYPTKLRNFQITAVGIPSYRGLCRARNGRRGLCRMGSMGKEETTGRKSRMRPGA